MHSTHEAELDIPTLPLSARHVHIVPDLADKSLISVRQLCDSQCKVSFTEQGVQVIHNDQIILTGDRSPTTQLYTLNLPVTNHENNSAIGTATPANLVAHAHASLFSPALSTLEKALQQGLINDFPGLSLETLRKYPPQSFPMIKGHLDQSRKNQRSTKSKIPPLDDDEIADLFPTSLSDDDHQHGNCCYLTIINPTGQIYTDQTGLVVAPASSGNKYLMILYEYDSNLILAEPMKSREGKSILTAFSILCAKLCNAGLKPKLHRLDNECPKELKQFLNANSIEFQLVPPGVHRRNAAERAIRTFKNHLIAGLCSADKEFPIHLWDELIPQATISLNLMRRSRINARQSAWTQFNGKFEYNKTPLMPPGMRVLAHDKPHTRTTFSPHALDGWYVGPAMESYRCHRVWIWETRSIRICDTLSWFPSKVHLPTVTTNDMINASLRDIIHAIQNPTPDTTMAKVTDSQSESLRIIAAILDPPPPEAPTITDAPSLRVEDAPPLRVAATIPTAPISPPSPTVEVPPALPTTPKPTVPKPTTPTAPAPPVAQPTFDSSTGPTGIKNRKSERVRTKSFKAQALSAILDQEAQQRSAKVNQALAATNFPTQHFTYLGSAVNPDTGLIAEYTELLKSSEGQLWEASATDEVGRLCQGHGPNMPKGSETMIFITVGEIPKGIIPTYLRIVCAWRPEKENPRRVRFTIGGDRIDYRGDPSTKTADLSTVKLLINSVLSTKGAMFMTIDIKDFYLNTPMQAKDFAYMRIPIHALSPHIMEYYKLKNKIHKGHVYVRVEKGMYGLKQAGRLANDQLVEFLKPHGYAPCPITPGLWKHETRDIVFTLVVDDFGVRYTKQEDADHLIAALQTNYKISIDRTGTKYCGLDLAWDYTARTCDVSMPGYIERAIARFQHPRPQRPEHSPHAWQKPEYGAKTQYAEPEDTTPRLDAADTKLIQEILGTLLYYARAVDSTLLAAIGTLASQQAQGTHATMKAITQLLNYCCTHPEATVRYVASEMILHVESDASYLSETKARSRAAGYHYLSNKSSGTNPPPLNGAINIHSQILREVVSSAAEAELAALFHNAKEACPLRIALNEMGHEQPATPIVTDNSTAAGIANDTVKQKRSKAMDMRFYWVRDRTRQNQFEITWRAGKTNLADYFSKHHPSSHHRDIRSTYLYDPNNPNQNYFEILADTTQGPTKITKPSERKQSRKTNAATTAKTTAPNHSGEGVLISGPPGSIDQNDVTEPALATQAGSPESFAEPKIFPIGSTSLIT